MFRISLASLNEPLPSINPDMSLYEGTIIESSPACKVIEFFPSSYGNPVKAIIRSAEDARIGDKVSIAGSLRDISVNFKNPGNISWKGLKRLEGIFYEVRGNILSVQKGNGIIENIRRRFAERIDLSGARNTAVIKALSIGDTSGLDLRTKDLFMKTGTSHILSISGSHFGIVTGFFFFVITLIFRMNTRLAQKGSDRQFAAIMAIPFAVAFMLVSGSSLPAIRATIMIIIYMLSIFFDRSRHGENGLFLTILIILVFFPHSLLYPSFQLTCLSVLFIILISGKLNRYIANLNGVLKWCISGMAVTIAATLGTLPVILYHFQGFNPFSVIHNFIAVPLLCIVATPLALLGLVLPFGDILLRLAGENISFTIGLLDRMNWGYIYPIIRPDLFEIILYLSAMVSAIFIAKRHVRIVLFAGILPITIIMAGITCYHRLWNGDLSVHYIDVGLGDAILVEAPHGMRILIDGGGFYGSDFDMGKSVIAPFLLARKIKTLDYVINTHPHQDHIAGLRHVLRYFRVNRFLSGYLFAEDTGLQEILHQNNIPMLSLRKGDRVPLAGGADFSVLHSGLVPLPRGLNESSLVFRIAYGEKSFMFTGDIGEETERSLVLSDLPLRSSVLKVPHHGSRYSSTPEFLSALRPDIAVLSSGPGIRGIPSQETIRRYANLNIPLYRTDRDGCVTVRTDGKNLTVETAGK